MADNCVDLSGKVAVVTGASSGLGRQAAIVLAGAGLRRLGMDDRPHWRIPTNICLPAVGQGTLALEGRATLRRRAVRGWQPKRGAWASAACIMSAR